MTADGFPDSYFTAVPNAGHVLPMRENYYRKAKDSVLMLLTALKKAEIVFDGFDALEADCQAIDVSDKIPPAFFFFYFKAFELAQDTSQPPEITQQVIIEHLKEYHGMDRDDAKRRKWELKEFYYESILLDFWEAECIEQAITDAGKKEQPFMVLTSAELEWEQPTIMEAMRLLELVDADVYEEVRQLIYCLKLGYCDDTVAISAPRHFGAVYCSTPERNQGETMSFQEQVYFYLEHIVHEVSHLTVNIMFAEDKLILNNYDKIYDPPIRRDKRHMYGVYHAVFVLSRMCRVFHLLAKKGHKVDHHIDRFVKMFDKGMKVVEESAQMTDKGRMIFESFRVAALLS